MEKPTLTQIVSATVAVAGLSLTVLGVVVTNATRISVLEEKVGVVQGLIDGETKARTALEREFREYREREYLNNSNRSNGK